MNSTDEYLEYILDKFRGMETVSAKRMFGGWVIHMAGKVLGFVFEDTFLFEPGPTIDKMLPDAARRELFPGSKLFVVIDESMPARRLCELAQACYNDFPVSKPRKRKGKAAEIEEQRQKEIEKRFPFAKYVE